MHWEQSNEVYQLRGARKRKRRILLADIGDGGENRDSEEVAEDAEDELVDPGIEGHFGNYVVAPIEELHHRHRRVSPLRVLPDLAPGGSRHLGLFSNPAAVESESAF